MHYCFPNYSALPFCYTGLPYIHHNVRGHFPLIDGKKYTTKKKAEREGILIFTVLFNKNPSQHFATRSSLNFMGTKFIVRHSFKHAVTKFTVQNFHAQVCQDIPHSCSFDLKNYIIFIITYFLKK